MSDPSRNCRVASQGTRFRNMSFKCDILNMPRVAALFSTRLHSRIFTGRLDAVPDFFSEADHNFHSNLRGHGLFPFSP